MPRRGAPKQQAMHRYKPHPIEHPAGATSKAKSPRLGGPDTPEPCVVSVAPVDRSQISIPGYSGQAPATVIAFPHERSAAIDRLPEAYATALRLQDDGHDNQVIAARLGLAPEAVDTLLNMATAKLRTLLTLSERPMIFLLGPAYSREGPFIMPNLKPFQGIRTTQQRLQNSGTIPPLLAPGHANRQIQITQDHT